MGTTRRVGSEQRSDRVHQAAWELFTSQGFGPTTIRQIAASAQVSIGTVINNGDKGALLVRLFEEALSQRIAAADQAPPQDSASLTDDVWSRFRLFFDFYATVPDLSRAYLRELLADRPRRTGGFELADVFMGQLTRVLTAACPESSDAAPLASTLFAVYLATLFGWLSGPYPLEAALDGCRSLVAHHVASFEQR